MTVRQTEDAVILEGRCGIEDAETLLLALQDRPDAAVDTASIEKLHMAVAQILLAVRPVIRGEPSSPFLARHIFGPLISDGDRQPKFA